MPILFDTIKKEASENDLNGLFSKMSVICDINSYIKQMLYNTYNELPNYMEYWTDLKNAYPEINAGRYYISTFGRVFSTYLNNILQQQITSGGYHNFSVTVRGEYKKILVHRAVLLSFYPILNSDDYEVNHKDTNKSNNWVYNLEWSTRLENAKHAVENGLYLRGEDVPQSIYTEEQIHKMCQGLMQRLPHEDIAKFAGLNYTESVRSTIVQLKSYKTWAHIAKQYDFPKEPGYQSLTNDEVEQLCSYIDNGVLNPLELISKIGKDKESLPDYNKIINDIRLGRRYVSISNKYNFGRLFLQQKIVTRLRKEVKELLSAGIPVRDILNKLKSIDYKSLLEDDKDKYRYTVYNVILGI